MSKNNRCACCSGRGTVLGVGLLEKKCQHCNRGVVIKIDEPIKKDLREKKQQKRSAQKNMK